MAIHITVPVDAQRASPNQRGHWAKLAKVKKEFRDAARLCWIAAGKPKVDAPVNVNVIIRRGRVIDQDNAQACLKSLIDGLFNDAVTPNDSRKWVLNYTVNQETGRVWQYQPEVEFVVEVAR
jgi:hypothetical protein